MLCSLYDFGALIGINGKFSLAAKKNDWDTFIEFINANRYLLACQPTPHKPSMVSGF